PSHLGLSERESNPPPSVATTFAPSSAPASGLPASGPFVPNPLADAERAVVESALERAQGVVSRAAAELGLSRQALYRRMDRLGIAIERRVR
ncbi:MAG: helix-turn-helix domain-containing protein, partial [Deltaproteobacteria bacterium]